MTCAVNPPWEATADRLKSAVERLVAVAHPRLIILFGSRARGDADVFSDVDLLVVEATVSDRYEEMVRLSRSLRGLLLPVDLLVVSEQEFDRRSETPGTVEHAARREGRVLYAA
jgi:predicted nucleotidyltransferase